MTRNLNKTTHSFAFDKQLCNNLIIDVKNIDFFLINLDLYDDRLYRRLLSLFSVKVSHVSKLRAVVQISSVRKILFL